MDVRELDVTQFFRLESMETKNRLVDSSSPWQNVHEGDTPLFIYIYMIMCISYDYACVLASSF